MRNLKENFPHSTGNRAENAQDPKLPHGQTGNQNPASDDAWKIHFSLGENVRFTRTPEVELMRRRGEELPSINERSQIHVEPAPSINVEKVAEAQPMAVAELQKTVSQSMVRSPVAPVPPAMPAVPVAVAVAVAVAPTEPAAKATQGITETAKEIQPSAFALLSDFAFWEGCSIDAALAPAEPLVSAAPIAPAEPRKPVPTVESILAQFRIREWTRQPEPASVAPVEPVVETPPAPAPAEMAAPQPAAAVEVKAPSPETTPDIAGEATDDEVVLTVAEAEEHVVEETPAPEPVIEKPAPVKAAPSIALYQPQPLPRAEAPVIHGTYEFPPRDLLQMPPEQDGNVITQEMLERSAGLLESVLEDFGVRGEIIHVRPGPVVTLYEFEPAPGVKSSRVIGLADDIARSMSALSARVAVVPGRNVIGIELPNANRETVYLREMIDSRTFEAII